MIIYQKINELYQQKMEFNQKSNLKRTSVERNKNKKRSIVGQLNVLRYQTVDTVKTLSNMWIETDQHFIQDVTRIASIKQDLITNFINYNKSQSIITDEQCDQIDFKARLHWDANILNSNTMKQFQDVDGSDRCECGCKRAKGKPIQIFSDEQKLNVLGPGVILHFMYLKAIVICICFFIAIYGIFAITTNLNGFQANLEQCKGFYCKLQRTCSTQNKLSPETNQNIQEWLGLLFCIFWIMAIRVIKYHGREKAKFVDDRLNSAADLAVKIDNLPYSQYSQSELLEYLDDLWEKIEDKEEDEEDKSGQGRLTNKFGVKSIQVVYNLEWARRLLEQIFEQSQMVNEMLKQNEVSHLRNVIKDDKEYKNMKIKLISSYELLKDLRKKFLNDQQFRKNITTSCCLVEFENSDHQQYFLKHYGAEKISFLKTIQEKIKKMLFPASKIMLFKGHALKITRAPEPTDLSWHNCEKTYSLCRIAIIHSITSLIIFGSFGIISGLDFFQEYMQKKKLLDGNLQNIIVNLAIVAALQLVNKFIWFSLFYLLAFEYNHCLTDKIISQMNKSLLATSINAIVLPIVSTYIVRGRLYGADGLAGMAFDYQVSFLVVAFANSLDPLDLIKRILLWIRKTRNSIIRVKCGKIQQIHTENGVPEINQMYQGPYFDIAQNYIKVTGAILHAAFFCHLQPSVIFLVVIMVFLFYMLSKYKLYRRCKIPQVTDYMVFDAAINQVNVVPIIYGVGTIITSLIENKQNPSRPLIYLPAFLCIGLGVLSVANPGDILNKIIKLIMQQNKEKKIKKSFEQETKIRISIANSLQSVVNRNETYFQDSNALVLLGFQCMLRGQNIKNLTKQLRDFCQSFLGNNQKDIMCNIKDFNNLNLTSNPHNNKNYLLTPLPPHIKTKITSFDPHSSIEKRRKS